MPNQIALLVILKLTFKKNAGVHLDMPDSKHGQQACVNTRSSLTATPISISRLIAMLMQQSLHEVFLVGAFTLTLGCERNSLAVQSMSGVQLRTPHAWVNVPFPYPTCAVALQVKMRNLRWLQQLCSS